MPWQYAAAEAVLLELAAAIPAYEGMSYAKVGDQGELIASERLRG
jgi:predicted molibdopterin-dependent oxidoreductase YjgC